MQVRPTFSAVYRLVRGGQAITDGELVGQIQASDPTKLPQGGIHMNHPWGKAKGYYIITEPDTDTFNPMIDNLGSGGQTAYMTLDNALLAHRQDIDV